jgi:hypothetical protein
MSDVLSDLAFVQSKWQTKSKCLSQKTQFLDVQFDIVIRPVTIRQSGTSIDVGNDTFDNRLSPIDVDLPRSL